MAAGAETVGVAFYERMKKMAEGSATPLDVGARLAVYLGSAESDGITGKLIAELATGRPTSVDLAPFRADRF